MSHFTVMVRLPAANKCKNLKELEVAVGAVLDAYCEHTDNGRLARFHDDFRDTEDEYRKKWGRDGGLPHLEAAE